MTPRRGSSTSVTLLEHLRDAPADRDAWEAFYLRYVPKILGWCRRWGVQEADAEDVTQVVLARIAERMGRFCYDPERSFRAYVKTLTRYAVCDLRQTLARPDVGRGGSRAAASLDAVEAREDLERLISAEFDLELLREAMRRASRRVEPGTWEAFRLLAEEGLPSGEVAARLGVKVAKVYVAKCRVLKAVRQELGALGGLGEPRDASPPLGEPGDDPLPEP